MFYTEDFVFFHKNMRVLFVFWALNESGGWGSWTLLSYRLKPKSPELYKWCFILKHRKHTFAFPHLFSRRRTRPFEWHWRTQRRACKDVDLITVCKQTLRLVSPSRLAVVMWQVPSARSDDSSTRSAGNVSSLATRTMSPTWTCRVKKTTKVGAIPYFYWERLFIALLCCWNVLQYHKSQ